MSHVAPSYNRIQVFDSKAGFSPLGTDFRFDQRRRTRDWVGNMFRQVVLSSWPFFVAILAGIVLLRLLVGWSGARFRLANLFRLHRDEVGGVQSLSFVITLPLFIIVMMFVVQLAQIMIAKVVVEYAAFAAARSAMVWIPANLGTGQETENEIFNLQYNGEMVAENGRTYSVYAVQPEGAKFNKIHLAAATACMPLCPSRNVGVARTHPGNAAAMSLQKAYVAMAPSSAANTRVPARLENKLAYALENTDVRVEIRHKGEEPALQVRHDRGPYHDEYLPNEVGWQDQLVVSVTHHFALLPGPGRLLARRADAPPGSSPEASYGGGRSAQDRVSQDITRRGGVYVYSLSATARLGNEGQKPLLPFVQKLDNWAWPSNSGYDTGYPDDGPDAADQVSEEHIYDRDEDTYWRRETEDSETGDRVLEEDSGQNTLTIGADGRIIE